MAVGLVIFAVILLVLCLCLSCGAAPASPGRNVVNSAAAVPEAEEQKFIVVKLPDSCLVPENYSLDLKVTLHRGEGNPGGGEPDLNGRRQKNRYHKLDEYM